MGDVVERGLAFVGGEVFARLFGLGDLAVANCLLALIFVAALLFPVFVGYVG